MARILVVDDDKPHLEALCTILRDEGHEVTGCSDSRSALDVLAVTSVDLMLSDLQMPHLDGVGLVREASLLDTDLVAILMTGHGSVDAAVEAMKVGVVDYIAKPFRMSTIRPVLARALEIRRLRVANSSLLQQVTQANAQLTETNQELSNFAGRIAHDLQSIMGVMQGFASLLNRTAALRLDEKEQGYVKRIIEASKRGDLLIKDMLAFARLGARPMELISVSLADVLGQAQQALDAEAQNRHVEWEVGQLPTVQCDPSLLQQVFVNLLSNALKYTRPRDIARIQIKSSETAQGHEVRVRDNGVGFDPAAASRLFLPFERLHHVSEFEGNGMGLANVQRIIERHGGTVRAQATAGEGAEFSFTLPARAHA